MVAKANSYRAGQRQILHLLQAQNNIKRAWFLGMSGAQTSCQGLHGKASLALQSLPLLASSSLPVAGWTPAHCHPGADRTAGHPALYRSTAGVGSSRSLQ